MAQSQFYATGFEAGDGSELFNLFTSTVQSVTVHSGTYALKCDATGVILFNNMAATKSVLRFYIYLGSLPGSTFQIVQEVSAAPSSRTILNLKTDGTLQVVDGDASLGLSTTGGSHALSTGAWNIAEIALDLAAGGVVKTWVNGVLDINTTHTNDVSATAIQRYDLRGLASPNQYFYDDVRVDQGGVAQIGPILMAVSSLIAIM